MDNPLYLCIDCGRPIQHIESRGLCELCLADHEDLMSWLLVDPYRCLFPSDGSQPATPSNSGDRQPPRRGEATYDAARLRRLLDDW